MNRAPKARIHGHATVVAGQYGVVYLPGIDLAGWYVTDERSYCVVWVGALNDRGAYKFRCIRPDEMVFFREFTELEVTQVMASLLNEKWRGGG